MAKRSDRSQSGRSAAAPASGRSRSREAKPAARAPAGTKQPTAVPSAAAAAGAWQGRMLALVIAVAALLHLSGPWLVDRLGLDFRYANLLSLIAIAAFIWSFVVAWRIWTRRREE